MILLVWGSDKATDLAHAIEHALHEPAQVAPDVHEACKLLQAVQYSAIVCDQSLFDIDRGGSSALFQHLGMAVPVFVNFATTSEQRTLHELQGALVRRRLETAQAWQNAQQALRMEFKDDVTALLLACGIARIEPSLTDSARNRLQQIEELGNRMKIKLGEEDKQEERKAAAAASAG